MEDAFGAHTNQQRFVSVEMKFKSSRSWEPESHSEIWPPPSVVLKPGVIGMSDARNGNQQLEAGHLDVN